MVKSKNLSAYFLIFVFSIFSSGTIYAQEDTRSEIYADEYMRFLLPQNFKSELDTEKPFQVCLSDNIGSRIYLAVVQKTDRKTAEENVNGADNIIAAEKKIADNASLSISDYGSKFLGARKQKINWLHIKRTQARNDCLMIYFWEEGGKGYLFLLDGEQIKMAAMIKELEENIIFLKVKNKK